MSPIIKFFLLILAPTCVVVAVTAFAEEPVVPAGYKLIFQTPDKFLSIYCNGTLERARAEKVAADVQAAYNFIIEKQQWSDRAPLAAPLHVHVEADMKNSGLLGFALKNVFTFGLSNIDKPLAQGTIAHELTHCQDMRQLKGHRVPNYFMEGRALLMGRAYRTKLGQKPDGYDRSIKKHIAKFTAKDVDEVLTPPPGPKIKLVGPALDRMEFMGCFFVDFLRTRLNGGLPDIQPRTARVVIDVGQGMSFQDAFKKEIGVSLEEAKKAFVAHIIKTEGDLTERVQGTVWQDL